MGTHPNIKPSLMCSSPSFSSQGHIILYGGPMLVIKDGDLKKIGLTKKITFELSFII